MALLQAGKFVKRHQRTFLKKLAGSMQEFIPASKKVLLLGDVAAGTKFCKAISPDVPGGTKAKHPTGSTHQTFLNEKCRSMQDVNHAVKAFKILSGDVACMWSAKR